LFWLRLRSWLLRKMLPLEDRLRLPLAVSVLPRLHLHPCAS
jgi:hypothetical protein